jgi:hypothetical protein
MYTGASGSQNVDLPNNPIAGNFVVCGIATGGISDVTSVADDNGNPYTKTTNSASENGNDKAYVYYLANAPANASKTIVITTSNGNVAVWCAEFSGVAKTNPLETDVQGNGTGATINTPSLSTSNDGDLLISVAKANATITSANSPWTGISTVQDGNYAEYYVQPAHGSQAIAFTQNSSAGWTSMGAAFKPEQSGGEIGNLLPHLFIRGGSSGGGSFWSGDGGEGSGTVSIDAANSPAVVIGNASTPQSTNSFNVSENSLVVLVLAVDNSGGTCTASIADNKGNTYSRYARSNTGGGGCNEVWGYYYTGTQTGVIVTATITNGWGAANTASMVVKVLTGASSSQPGTVVTSNANSNASLTPQSTGSYIFGAVEATNGGSAYTVYNANTASLNENHSAGGNFAQLIFQSTNTTSSLSAVTYGASNSQSSQDFTAVEIKPALGGGMPAAAAHSDTFTAANNTALATHNSDWADMDSGMYLVSNIEIYNNQVRPLSASTPAGAMNSASGSDTSQMLVKAYSDTSVWKYICVRAGLTGGTYKTGYCITFNAASGGNWTRAGIYKGGTLVQNSSAISYSQASDHTLKVTASGTNPVTVNGYIDGVLVVTYSDSSSPYGTGGHPGFLISPNGSNTVYMDDWNDGTVAVTQTGLIKVRGGGAGRGVKFR